MAQTLPELPQKLDSFVATRDRRVVKARGYNGTPIRENLQKLLAGQVVRVGGRTSCGPKVDASWVEFAAWNEVMCKARALGYVISETPIKHGNGWATKARGFWDENDYQLMAEEVAA